MLVGLGKGFVKIQSLKHMLVVDIALNIRATKGIEIAIVEMDHRMVEASKKHFW
jgi:hypothetical protein